jgi:hypothetical protein
MTDSARRLCVVIALDVDLQADPIFIIDKIYNSRNGRAQPRCGGG